MCSETLFLGDRAMSPPKPYKSLLSAIDGVFIVIDYFQNRDDGADEELRIKALPLTL